MNKDEHSGPLEGSTREGICLHPSSLKGPLECGIQICRLPISKVILNYKFKLRFFTQVFLIDTALVLFYLSIFLMGLESVVFWLFMVEETSSLFWAYGLNDLIRGHLDRFQSDLILQNLE